MMMLESKGVSLSNFTTKVTLVVICLFLVSCANEPNANPKLATGSQWDFDHQLQYKQYKLSENTYQLEVINNNSVNFDRLSAFLLRRGYVICGQYGYKFEVLKGVEGFDHLRASPNLIMSNLTAKLECPISE